MSIGAVVHLILWRIASGCNEVTAEGDRSAPLGNRGWSLTAYCTDHILQLTCKLCYDVPKKLADTIGKDYAASVTKARALVSYFNSSTQAAELLHKTQMEIHGKKANETLKVVTDVVTRWWSTHAMIN